jgi:mono/diheme cytochrome c family protein
MSKRTVFLSIVVVVLVALVVAACGGGGGGAAAPSTQGDAKAGAQAWASKPCAGCHGANAEGGAGPRLAGTSLTLDRVKNTVRNGRGGEMPKFSADQVSDADIANIYAWLKSQ